MSNKDKPRRNDGLKSLPTEVLLKARSTLFSISGALKPKSDRSKLPKDPKNLKKQDTLKSSRSESEFSEIRTKHRSRTNDLLRDGVKPRPLSVGAVKRYDKEPDVFQSGSFLKDVSPLRQRLYESSDDVCVRLTVPSVDRLSSQEHINDVSERPRMLMVPTVDRLSSQEHINDGSERPRKKLSFREPEIVGSGSATLGRSHKLMGVNSLTRKTRNSLRAEVYSSLDGIDSDLESQAMRIVRTVGQAFEVCHKLQLSNPPEDDQPLPSTSSAADLTSEIPHSKEAPSDCGVSDPGASTSKTPDGPVPVIEFQATFPLPPPPRKAGKRSPKRRITPAPTATPAPTITAAPTVTPAPSINLPVLPDLPECLINLDLNGGVKIDEKLLASHHTLQLLEERLEQQVQQTRAAVAQLLLVRDQLAVEQAARCEAQSRTHQLLVHNKELLDHIASLVAHLKECEQAVGKKISAQHLTLLPQAKDKAEAKEDTKAEKAANGFEDNLIDLITENNKLAKHIENNNNLFDATPIWRQKNNNSSPTFDGMTNEQIQNFLISKFEDMGGFPNGNAEPKTPSENNNQQYFQNSKAFPDIPPLANHYSHDDIADLMKKTIYKDKSCSADEIEALAQAMSLGQSENSLCDSDDSDDDSSKDSSPDDSSSDDSMPFIMPLSQNGTLTATGEDGRVRVIVPVSPSESMSDVASAKNDGQGCSGVTLKVPGLAPAAPITRSTSEKVPNRSEMMTALRSQWTRHTTK